MLEPDEYKVIAVKSWREATADVVAPGRKFLLFVAADVGAADAADLVDWATPLVLGGCRGMAAWGANCTLVDDAFDWAVVWEEIQQDRELELVMTTWHDKDSLEEALWYFLRSMPQVSAPELGDRYSMVAVVEDRGDWLERVRAAFADPEGFCDHLLDEEGD